MARNPRPVVPWWFIVFCSVSTLAGSQLSYNRGSSATELKTPVGTYGRIQPQQQQQKSTELSELPRRVAVKCHPDTMEVVVPADLFSTGLELDGEHLRLGSNFWTEDGDCGAVPSGEDEFTLLTWLTGCGTELSVSTFFLLGDTSLLWLNFHFEILFASLQCKKGSHFAVNRRQDNLF